MYYTIIVKGPAQAALKATRQRGINASVLNELGPFGYTLTVLKVEGEAIAPLQAWINEYPEKPPFPDGTLLIFGQHKES